MAEATMVKLEELGVGASVRLGSRVVRWGLIDYQR
jgi:hypothetical protein